MEKKEMNIYEKLIDARLRLQDFNLTKTGKNSGEKFGYTYFELADFLPELNKILKDVGLCSIIDFSQEIKKLKLINISNVNEFIEFYFQDTAVWGEGSKKMMSPIQEEGAKHTYIRRYLYMDAFEICANDEIDSPNNNSENNSQSYIDMNDQDFFKFVNEKYTIGYPILNKNFENHRPFIGKLFVTMFEDENGKKILEKQNQYLSSNSEKYADNNDVKIFLRAYKAIMG